MGRSRRIAPALARMVDAWVLRTQGTRSHREARRELRALLRVYREAAKSAGLIESCHRNGGQTCAQDWHLWRAVESMKRLSARGPQGRSLRSSLHGGGDRQTGANSGKGRS